MEKIALPKKIEFQAGSEANEGNIIIGPLFPGYGMTLGNSLRRVLLSSLPGAAVTGVKIKGASHEFMALEHVKEDILEIVLNLKQLRLKIHSEEEIKLELSVSGKKVVTAADVVKNSQVEVVNPELILAHLTDPAGNLEMEIYAKSGRGYQLSDTSEKGKGELGFIEMDAIFSPILSVALQNENVRVGKMTNWDKLILKVKTDGTITFEEAFNQTVEILIDQFQALLPGALASQTIIEEKEEEIKVEEAPVIEEEVEEKPKSKKKK